MIRMTMFLRVGIAVFCVVLASPAGNAETDPDAQLARLRVQKEQALLLKLEHIEDDQGVFSPEQISHLLNLGLLYIEKDRCADAVSVLRRAIKLSRANFGMYNMQQMEIEEPLRQCYIALDLPGDFSREQEYALLVTDRTYGRRNLRALPGLQRIAAWYEQAGWYLSARTLYMRSIDIATRILSANDLLLVDPLRSLARTYRLEYMYGLERAEIKYSDLTGLPGKPNLVHGPRQLDPAGEKSLKRAIKILRNRADPQRMDLVDALLDLGDWYQTGFMRRDALKAWREALQESTAPDYAGETLFTRPAPVLYVAREVGLTLHHPPPDPGKYVHYWASYDFTVTQDGGVEDVTVVDSDAPLSMRWQLADNFKQARYRPRFVDGEPVDTEHVHTRLGMYMLK